MDKKIDISEDWVKSTIDDFITTSPLNTMEDGTDEPAWDQALVGFASGTDQIFTLLYGQAGEFFSSGTHAKGSMVSPELQA